MDGHRGPWAPRHSVPTLGRWRQNRLASPSQTAARGTRPQQLQAESLIKEDLLSAPRKTPALPERAPGPGRGGGELRLAWICLRLAPESHPGSELSRVPAQHQHRDQGSGAYLWEQVPR